MITLKSDYKTRLIKLHMLPLMYYYNLSDILFSLSQLNSPPVISISTSLSISVNNPQDCPLAIKLNSSIVSTNKHKNHYFIMLFLHVIDLDLPMSTIKFALKKYFDFWDYFVSNFNNNLMHVYLPFHLSLLQLFKAFSLN